MRSSIYIAVAVVAAAISVWIAPKFSEFSSQVDSVRVKDEDALLWGAEWNISGYKPIAKKTWAANKTDPAQLIKHRIPLILKKSPASEWAEQPVTDVLSLHDAFNSTRVQNHSPVFVLRASTGRWKPGPGYADRVLEEQNITIPSITLQDVSVEEFLARDNDSSVFMYFTTPLEQWQPPLTEKIVVAMQVQEDDSIVPNTTDGDPLPWKQQVWGGYGIDQEAFVSTLFPPTDVVGGGNVDRGYVNIDPHAMLWFSQQNVTAHWHYDVSHNWFVQLHGEKRILLAPPSAAHDMMLFPSIHPSYHQSQHRPSEYGPLLARGLDGDDQEAPSLTAFARAKRSMLAVVVRPGDVLYIPPFWFHTVTALNLSLSLSVISPSEEEMIFSKAFWTKVPLGKLTSPRDKRIGVQLFIAELLAAAAPLVTSPPDFIGELLNTRYQPFYAWNASRFNGSYPACSLPPRFACYRDTDANKKQRAVVEKQHQRVFHDVAVNVTSVLLRTAMSNGKYIDGAIAVTLLEDYIEEMATFAVGACNVAAYLSACFL